MDPTLLLKSMVLIIPAAVLGSYVMGLSLAAAIARMTGRRGRISFQLADYLNPLGMLCYLFNGFGWGRLEAFDHPAAQSFSAQMRLHAVQFLAAVFLGGVAMLIQTFMPPLELQTASRYLQIVMTQIVLAPLSSAILLMVPLYPAPGYATLKTLLPFRKGFFLDRYQSTMAVIVVAAVILWNHWLVVPARVFLAVVLHGGLPAILGLMGVALFGLWWFCRPQPSFIE